MRKLLLIAALAFATVAWAQTAGMNSDESQQTDQNFNQQQNQQMDQGLDQRQGTDQGFSQQRGGDDWYNRVLSAAVDDLARTNETIAPSQTAFLEQPELFNTAQPGAIASNAGSSNNDWYNQKVAAEAEFDRRAESALKSEEALSSGPE